MRIFTNFIQSYRKELKLLYNKKFYLAALIFSLILLSCNEKEKEKPENKLDLNTPEAVLTEAKKVLGNDAQITVPGHFDRDTTREFTAGTEINKPDVWGIRFYLLKEKGPGLQVVDSTALLEGSFTDALVRKEKLSSGDYDMIYYNSLDYYLGSGGGEVFAYLIDFSMGQTYYAHLIIGESSRISLFISANSAPEIKNYFLGVFKKDYPNLRLVDKDINLDD
jgi:hypothetical protein